MSENPTSDKPPGRPNTRKPLEDALEKASQQAQDLSDSVGAEPATNADIDLTPRPEVAAHNSLDAHFDEIEALLNVTAEELGRAEAETPDEDDPDGPDDAAPAPPSEPDPTPLDEAEITQVDWPEDPAEGLDDHVLRAADEIPDVPPDELPILAADIKEQPKPAPPKQEAPPPRPSRHPVKAAIQSIRRAPAATAHAAAACLATMLDLFDKPFTRLSYDIRYLCGWAAVVTFIMAGIVITLNGGF
jgi:hypothetical protein